MGFCITQEGQAVCADIHVKVKPIVNRRIKRKNYREPIPEGAKLVARPSRWGNPYPIEEYSLDKCLILYEKWLDSKLIEDPTFLDPLKGFTLLVIAS